MIRYRNELLVAITLAVLLIALPHGVSAQTPQVTPTSSVKAAANSVAESNDKDVLHAVEQVRDDLRALRHEVDNLRALLETANKKSESRPSPPARRRGASAGAGSKEPLLTNGVYFFTAEWCGPCREMRPLIERLKREGLPIVDVDVDQRRDLRDAFRIDKLPSFVLLVDGKLYRDATGMRTEAELRAFLAKIPNARANSATPKPGQGATSNVKTDPKAVPSIAAAIVPAPTAHHDSPRRARRAAGKSAEYELRSYPVADLVVPTPGKPKTPVNGNIEKLIGLLTDTVEPASWQKAGGKGQILQSDKTLSLIVRQTPAIHRQVFALLRNLRALQSWHVCLELAIVKNAPAGLLKRVGATCLPYNDPRVYPLSEEQRTALVAAARQNPGTESFAAKVTMLPGTFASIGAARNGTGTETIDIETIDSTDRYAVDLRLGVHDKKTGIRSIEPITVNVPNLKLVVIELKQTPTSPSTKPTLLVVRPRFLFPIEEEEQQETPHHSAIEPFEDVPIAE